jgi:hypothetical protein
MTFHITHTCILQCETHTLHYTPRCIQGEKSNCLEQECQGDFRPQPGNIPEEDDDDDEEEEEVVVVVMVEEEKEVTHCCQREKRYEL